MARAAGKEAAGDTDRNVTTFVFVAGLDGTSQHGASIVRPGGAMPLNLPHRSMT